MKKIVVFVSVVFVTQFSFSQKTTFKQDLIKFFEVAGTSPNERQNYFLSMIDASKHEDFKKELAVLLEDFYTKSAEVYQEEFSPTSLHFFDIYNCIGIVHAAKEEYSDALTYFKKAIHLRQQSLQPDHPDIAKCFISILLFLPTISSASIILLTPHGHAQYAPISI